MAKSESRSGAERAEERTWGIGTGGGAFLCLPLAAGVALTVLDGENWPIREMWPALVVLLIMTATCLRPRLRITADELMIRYPIGSSHVPRGEVLRAEFGSGGLWIYLRGGGRKYAFMMPKMNSSESTGTTPEPDSVARQITEWADTRA